MKIRYLDELNYLISVIKDESHPSHDYKVLYYKKKYGYKTSEEILVQLENRRDCLLELLNGFTQKDFETLFCFHNLNKRVKYTLYKRLMQSFSADFALYDYALAGRFRDTFSYWNL